MAIQSGQLHTSLINAGPQALPIDAGGPALACVLTSGATVTLNGATEVAVANVNVTANSIIVFTLKTVGGTVGAAPSVKTITPGTGFTVAGTALDTSIYNFAIIG
jgi:hypothetical protein